MIKKKDNKLQLKAAVKAFEETNLIVYDDQGNQGVFVERFEEKSLENDISDDLMYDASGKMPTQTIGSLTRKLVHRKEKKDLKVTVPDGFKFFLKLEKKKCKCMVNYSFLGYQFVFSPLA